MMDCYWLARFYQQNPSEFLRQTPATIKQHMKFSRKLLARAKASK
jgi:hypothetical protein